MPSFCWVKYELLFVRNSILCSLYIACTKYVFIRIKDVVWDIFVFALGNTAGFHLIRAKVCSVFKLKFALNIPYYVYLFLETRHTISRCHIATHFDLKACPSTFLNLFVVTKCLKHTLGYHDTDITIYMHQQTQKANMAKEVFV